MTNSFALGQLVAVAADPSRRGPVIDVVDRPGREPRYRVFHSAQIIREYGESQLVAVASVPAVAALTGLLLDSDSLLPADMFKAVLTAARLEHPLVDTLYAFRAARIQHVPFQFKPLLRLLRADQPRLLIADEVGVGKTIEAGLILRELETRQDLEYVLIVCPKALVEKWRMEMRRFDEDFRPLTSETLRYCIRETRLDGAWPAQYRRAIVHLELLRGHLETEREDGRVEGLVTLLPPPQFDLLVVDEAHHVRNPSTASHEVARFLCDVSETVLFLTATPVQLGSRDLFVLLSLLRPDIFPDMAVFDEMAAPNRHLTSAMSLVRSARPESWQATAVEALDQAAATPWGARVLVDDPRFDGWRRRLGAQTPLSDADRVACLRDLEETHSFAHVMNRTRRRDVGRFTIREPHTVSVPFTESQMAFYEAFIDYRRELLSYFHDPRVAALVISTIERQVTSCLPATVAMLDRMLADQAFAVSEFSESQDMDEELENGDLPSGFRQRAVALLKMAERLPPDDPKFDRLRELVKTTTEGDGPRKLLVFSFFLHTLAYLERRLRDEGLRVATVSGKVADEDRENYRDRFRLPTDRPEALDVLLSSEVGCEGLDYEFCDRLVNYDLPWNPMRVEQRIGRIDRFGQRADKVLIFNFITPDTVEERVFFRCYERLGIFRETVGDLEEVLGDVVQSLAHTALDPGLSVEQAAEFSRQMSDNALRKVEEQRRLEDESEGLLGLDQALTDEVESIDGEGRYVSAGELRQIVEHYLARPGVQGALVSDTAQPDAFKLTLSEPGRAALSAFLRSYETSDRGVVSLRRWLSGGDSTLRLTFDQTTAASDREITFVTPAHPLAKAAVAELRGGAATADRIAAAQLVVATDSVPAGRYVFVCDLWETIAAKPEVRLVHHVWSVDSKRIEHTLASRLTALIHLSGGPGEPLDIAREELSIAIEKLDDQAESARKTALAELKASNEILVGRRLASLEAHFQRRIERLAHELATIDHERIKRMKTAEKARIERDYAARRAEIESRMAADIVSQRVAAGILEVNHGE